MRPTTPKPEAANDVKRPSAAPSVAPRPIAAKPTPAPKSTAAKPAAKTSPAPASKRPIPARPAPRDPARETVRESVELRPKNKDESGIVSVRSMQPTLPGIGPDDEVMDACPVDSIPVSLGAPSSAPQSTVREPMPPMSAPSTVRDPSPPTVREPEHTIIEELDASMIVDERPAPPSVRPAPPSVRPSASVPILRVVPQATRAPQPALIDAMPAPSHAPAPPVSATVLGPSAERQVITPAPIPAPVAASPVPIPAPAAFAPQSHFPPPAVAPQMQFVPQFVPVPAPAIAEAPIAGPRPSLSDPMDVLFDAAYDLCFLQSAVEGATHAMNSGMRALGACGALVHLRDANTGEFVTIAAVGAGADRQMLSRHQDDDWLISAALFKSKPVTMEYGGEVSSRPLPRHQALGAEDNVIVVPIIAWGRALGVLEIVDASEAMLAGGRGENALAYLAQRLAEFLGEHEIVLGVA